MFVVKNYLSHTIDKTQVLITIFHFYTFLYVWRMFHQRLCSANDSTPRNTVFCYCLLLQIVVTHGYFYVCFNEVLWLVMQTCSGQLIVLKYHFYIWTALLLSLEDVLLANLQVDTVPTWSS